MSDPRSSPFPKDKALSLLLTSCWEIPPEQVKELSSYYLHHWSTDYFSRLYYNQSGRVFHNGTTYQILFYRGDIDMVFRASKVAISFRCHKDHKEGYALVRALPLTPVY